MPACRQAILFVAGCLLAAIVSQANAQDPSTRYYGSNARIVEFSEQRPSRPRRIAVVGDVMRPGVYQSSTRQLLASTLLTAAGSQALPGEYFTRFYNGLVPVPTATFQADTITLSHGDVIVVTASPNRRRLTTGSDDIHVVVIGLAPEPVVIRVRQGDRSLPVLFSRLQQPPDAAAGATINGKKSTDLLNNGDVIAVGSNLVDRAALAGCEDILPTRLIDEVAADTKATAGFSPPIEEQGSLELPKLDLPPTNELTAAVELPSTTDAPASTVPELTTVESPAPARAEELVRTAERPRLTRTSEFESPVTVRSQFAEANRQAVRNAAWEAPSVAGSDSGIRSLVVLLALGTLGLGVTLLWLASERRLRNAATPEPVALAPPVAMEPPVEDELDELIRGTLPVEDEPVVLPSRISLHGAAVGQKRLVIHPPQALAGPHFGATPAPAEKVAVSHGAKPAVTTPASTTDVPAGRPLPSPVKSPKDAEGLLDRVLLAMQREGRR